MMDGKSQHTFMDNGKNWITDRFIQIIPAKLSEWLLPLLSLAAVLTVWQLICTVLVVPEYVLPSPARIGAEIISAYEILSKHMAITLGEAAAGFILANFLSLIFALIFCYSPFFEKSGYPYMIAFQSIPLVALAPLINLWFGEGMISKVIMAGLMTFFPMVVNATHGLKSVSPLSLDVMRSMSASEMQIFTKLRIPTALPYIFSALRISAPLAVVGAIVAELTAASSGIGYLILVAAYRVQTPFLFSCIVFASIGGILFFGVAVLIGKILTHKKEVEILPAKRLMAHIRNGLTISEYTAMTINRFGGYEKLRAEVQWPEDKEHVERLTKSPYEKVRFIGYALYHNAIRGEDKEALRILQKSWDEADNSDDDAKFQIRNQLMWQILDANNLDDLWHRKIYGFVAESWPAWSQQVLNFTAQRNSEKILPSIRIRIEDIKNKEYPETKAWAYLLQTVISKNVKGVREIAAPYTNHSHFMVSRVANALVDEKNEQKILRGEFPGPLPNTI